MASFWKSDHSSVLLLPIYKQEAKKDKPTLAVQCWSAEKELKLQGCFESTDWLVFRDPTNLSEYTSTVTGYVKFSVYTCIPTCTVRT